MEISTVSYQTLPSGRIARCEPYGHGWKVVKVMDRPRAYRPGDDSYLDDYRYEGRP